MSSSQTDRVIRSALLRGCAGGLGMAVVYLVISALSYLVLVQTQLDFRLVLLFSILSGPVIGTGGFLAILYGRAFKSQSRGAAGIDSEHIDLL